MTRYRSSWGEGQPGDEDVYSLITLDDRQGNRVSCKVLLSDTVQDGTIEPVQGLVEGDVSFYLLISRHMMQKVAALGYLEMLNRALTLVVMELAEGTLEADES